MKLKDEEVESESLKLEEIVTIYADLRGNPNNDLR